MPADMTDCLLYTSVNSSPAWQHVFKGLEKTDKGTGETYQYRVLETAFILKNGETISVDNKDNIPAKESGGYSICLLYTSRCV